MWAFSQSIGLLNLCVCFSIFFATVGCSMKLKTASLNYYLFLHAHTCIYDLHEQLEHTHTKERISIFGMLVDQVREWWLLFFFKFPLKEKYFHFHSVWFLRFQNNVCDFNIQNFRSIYRSSSPHLFIHVSRFGFGICMRINNDRITSSKHNKTNSILENFFYFIYKRIQLMTPEKVELFFYLIPYHS